MELKIARLNNKPNRNLEEMFKVKDRNGDQRPEAFVYISLDLRNDSSFRSGGGEGIKGD